MRAIPRELAHFVASSGDSSRSSLRTFNPESNLLLHRRPDAMDVVVVVERLEEFADFGLLRRR